MLMARSAHVTTSVARVMALVVMLAATAGWPGGRVQATMMRMLSVLMVR